MTPEQVQLVSGTWRSVLPIRDTFAQLFYAKLFSLDPDMQALFAADMKEQGRNLVAMISIVVRNLSRPEAVHQALRELGRRHERYGVRAAHYETMRTALILTLDVSLGEAFSPATREAWELAYDLLVRSMHGEQARTP